MISHGNACLSHCPNKATLSIPNTLLVLRPLEEAFSGRAGVGQVGRPSGELVLKDMLNTVKVHSWRVEGIREGSLSLARLAHRDEGKGRSLPLPDHRNPLPLPNAGTMQDSTSPFIRTSVSS